MIARTNKILLAFFGISAAVGALLTLLLIAANPEETEAVHLLGVAVVALYIAVVVSAAFLVPVLMLWTVVLVAARKFRALVLPDFHAFLASGLFAFHLAWILWNEFDMAHQWASVRPFITPTGIGENLLVAVAALGTWIGGSVLGTVRSAPARAFGPLAIALSATVVGLLWHQSELGTERVYSLEEIRAESEARKPYSATRVERGDGRIILLCYDGFTWDVAAPLLEAGRLPGLDALIRDGVIGNLDNGDDNYSPRIWTSLYTGRSTQVHGIDGFQTVILTASGSPIRNLLRRLPSNSTFYGLERVFQLFPKAGLWSVRSTSSDERRVPTLWEVASDSDRRVVVVSPLVLVPVAAVNGAAVDLKLSKNMPAGDGFHPAELADRWGREPSPSQDWSQSETAETYRANAKRFEDEISFSIELFRDFDFELAVYYTHFVDTVSHFNWDFWARKDFLLRNLPIRLDNEQWSAMVAENATDQVFRAYEIADAQLRRIREAFPESTIVLVSDHGWTFSGYEHFNSVDGVLLISGPDVRSGVTDASIFDIAPTILSRMGVPVSQELHEPLRNIFHTENPTSWVASYPPHLPRGDKVEYKLDDTELERLRAIGYVQ